MALGGGNHSSLAPTIAGIEDYSDFTDRFDDIARMERELGSSIAFLEQIVAAAGTPPRKLLEEQVLEKSSNQN